ncbi:hypothetical protein D3C84_1302790 [compost metagenome]
MPPILEQPALATATPGDLVKQRLWITTQAGKQWQVMGAHQGIDRIDLHDAQAREHPLQMSATHR